MSTVIRTVPAILAAAFAATATLTANAATAIYWKGGSGTESEPRDVYDKDNWTASNTYSGNSIGKFPTGQHNFHFNTNSFPDQACCYLTNCSPNAVSDNVCEQMIFHNGDYAFRGSFKTISNFVLGYNAGDVASVAVDGGSLSVGGDVTVGLSGNGTLTINGGTVTVATDKAVGLADVANKTGTLNLNGGTLTTKKVQKGNNYGTGNLNFNGGTLKANAVDSEGLVKDGVTIKVEAGGGTIHCDGKNIAIDARWSTDSTGGMNFTGGNGNTISIPNRREIKYPGITSIAPGTRLAVSNLSAAKDLISNGVVVAGVPAQGDVIFTCTRGDGYTLDGVDVAGHVTCPIAPTTTFALDDSKTNIVVTSVGTSLAPAFWTGAANDGNLSNPANWTDNAVPGPGTNATILCATPATLTNGAGFAPSAITFLEGSAAVTIDGDFDTLTCVTNRSSVNQTFAGFVDFGDGNIDVTGGRVVFAGGTKGVNVANHTTVMGNYTLTTDNNFNATSSFKVDDDSSLSVKNTGDTLYLDIGEGATFNVNNYTRWSGGWNNAYRLWRYSSGTYVITNFTYKDGDRFWLGGAVSSSSDASANANAVLKVGTLTIDSDGSVALHNTGNNIGTTLTMCIGAGGVNIASGKTGNYLIDNSNHRTTMRPWNSDFTFGRGSNANSDFYLGNSAINFTLNTDDLDGESHTITMAARIQTGGNTSSITVAGHGTNVVTAASPLMTGTYRLTDSATARFTAGAGFANGTIALGTGTTLWLNDDSLVGTLNLPAGENEVATIRIDGTRLAVGDHTIATVGAGATANVALDPASTVLDGRKGSLSVDGSGNLVLTINPTGFVIIVR